MKQAILYGARDLRIEDSSLDCENLQPDQIYAETIVSALSTGTDLGNYLGDSTYVPGAPDYPRRIGYSNVAVVRRVGAAVSQPTVGQRVFSMQPHLSAYVARQSDILVTVPEAVSSEQASLAYSDASGAGSSAAGKLFARRERCHRGAGDHWPLHSRASASHGRESSRHCQFLQPRRRRRSRGGPGSFPGRRPGSPGQAAGLFW